MQNNNPALTTLGTAFESLTSLAGQIYFNLNPLLTDFEALRNLRCHGGVWENNPASFCVGCPSWLINLPRC